MWLVLQHYGSLERHRWGTLYGIATAAMYRAPSWACISASVYAFVEIERVFLRDNKRWISLICCLLRWPRWA